MSVIELRLKSVPDQTGSAGSWLAETLDCPDGKAFIITVTVYSLCPRHKQAGSLLLIDYM